ncbi:hypothetical protein D3C83_294210 [compost metagenome]
MLQYRHRRLAIGYTQRQLRSNDAVLTKSLGPFTKKSADADFFFAVRKNRG